MRPLVTDLFDDRYGATGRHTVSQCDQCGFGRTTPGLQPEKIGAFYAAHYPLAVETPTSVRQAARITPRWHAWLTGTDNIAHALAQPGTDVLDIGSASGVSLIEIGARGARAFGIEPDPTAAGIARQLGLKVHTGFITDHPFPRQSFDFITASQVIEHAPDPRAFLLAVAERLKPSGKIILSFPNLGALYRRIFGRRWLHWHIPYHLNFFTRRSFAHLAREAGLQVISSRTITPNLWTLIQLRSLLEKPQEGRMGRIWAAQHGRASSPPRGLTRLALSGSRLVGGAGIGFANRLIDSLGRGESFLVTLQKR
jgi:2-polyprenyl-3-methyl-5-hydroxy-6-metoxy-1,4-benzoquinol methylase